MHSSLRALSSHFELSRGRGRDDDGDDDAERMYETILERRGSGLEGVYASHICSGGDSRGDGGKGKMEKGLERSGESCIQEGRGGGGGGVGIQLQGSSVAMGLGEGKAGEIWRPARLASEGRGGGGGGMGMHVEEESASQNDAARRWRGEMDLVSVEDLRDEKDELNSSLNSSSESIPPG